MNYTHLFIFLAIGALAGWLAGQIVKGHGYGLLSNIVIGIAGSVIGGHLLGFFGIAAGSGLAGSIMTATLGAIALLFLIGLIKRV